MSAPSAFVLRVDKAEGPTSHDVVAEARRALGTRRIGHTGTLDPFASGLLLLCVGWATRLAEYLTGLDKSYEAVARLGVTTDTLDRDGDVVEESPGVDALSPSEVDEALRNFVGELQQLPPQFSAKKVGGVRMHERARRGERVSLEPCRVTVQDMEMVEFAPPDVRFRVRCSSGTYVRSLARDLGAGLGVGAHLTSLRRTAIGRFDVEGAVPSDRLHDEALVARAALSPLDALAHLPRVIVDAAGAAKLAHGQRLAANDTAPLGIVAVAGEGGLIAVAEVSDGVLAPRKVFAQ